MAFLQHSEWDVPGTLGTAAADRGLEVRTYRADRGPDALPRAGTFEALVVLGSAASVTDPTVSWIGSERDLVAAAVTAGVPVLGVCFGGQLLAHVLGADVRRATSPEIGWRLLETADADLVPAGPWLSWHEDEFTAPFDAEVVATTEISIHAFVHGIHTGVQFHPEVTPDVVEHWIADAREDGRLDAREIDDLRRGFADRPDGTPDGARMLLEGFLHRAGLVD